MSQLQQPPGRMRPLKETVSLEEARAVIDGAIRPVERAEVVRLERSSGRVVFRDLISETDVPPFARAAMDGYAVIAEDTFGAGAFAPRLVSCLERVYTGQVPTVTVGRGQCVEIATGAPMPAGADAVVMVEETERGDAEEIRIFGPVYPGQNVGRQGADITVGQVIVSAGTTLNASRIGALAAVGYAEVEVYQRPRVAILSTGNEIVEPGRPLEPGQIYDINRYTLSTIIEQHGASAIVRPTAADTLEELDAALEACSGDDMVVFSGGSSVGERDLILDAVLRRGEVLIHGIALKPGKPTLFGRIGGTPVFGMPGYPTSCLSNGYMLLVPALRRLARLQAERERTVFLPLGQRVVSTTGRHQFFTVRIAGGVAMPAFKASGDITSMSQADGYIEIAAQTDIVEKGEVVEVKLF
jgi:molybdopterin molybdotransferase